MVADLGGSWYNEIKVYALSTLRKRGGFMNLLRLFGIGSSGIIAKDCCTEGSVTQVSRCWWLKVNTKPVRRFSGDGAVYPSIITFSYQVGSISYTGKRYIPIHYRVPQKGETIFVYYDPEKPQKYACYAFGPAPKTL